METELTIAQGKLRGFVEQTEQECKYVSFLGIPYAKPPVGNLKFKAPQPPEPWIGILEANNDGHICLNHDMFQQKIIGTLDCLYLNVYTPGLPKQGAKLKPVMVWIHGGAFITGSKNRVFSDPVFIMDKDVVVVSINYRLGVLGFLSLKDSKLGVSGNAGMKDQVMALKWVQQNIAAFGGDPGNVTLFGVSAGGASVSYLVLSSMAKGLFHKAIMQSGAATCAWAQGNTGIAQEMIKALGKNVSSEAEMLAILENLDENELIEAQLKVPDIWKPNKFRYLAPTIETSTSEEHFLSDTPINILKSGNYNKVPIITGCTDNEGLLSLVINNGKRVDMRPTSDAEYVPYWLNINQDKATQIGKKIKHYYYGNETPNDENIQGYFSYFSDAYFILGAHEFAENFIKTSGNKVFLYNFAQKTNLNQMMLLFKIPMSYKGVAHGEDLLYMFKTAMSPPIKANSQEYYAIQRFTTWWTNFAKYSDPNGVAPNPVLDINWPAATENMEYLNIDNQASVGEKYAEKSAMFWKSIREELN